VSIGRPKKVVGGFVFCFGDTGVNMGSATCAKPPALFALVTFQVGSSVFCPG
jgi:hypothetical protein